MAAAPRPTLAALDAAAPFSDRHIGPRADDQAKMLATIGRGSLDALIEEAVPGGIHLRTPLALDRARTEPEVIAELRALAARNVAKVQMIGLGYSETVTPAVIRVHYAASSAV